MARIPDARVRQYWVKGTGVRAETGPGQVLIYSRGAGLDKPGLRVTNWESEVARVREFLGPTAPRSM